MTDLGIPAAYSQMRVDSRAGRGPAGHGARLQHGMLDSTVVNVALPTIGRHRARRWRPAVDGHGYTLTLAWLILLGGSLGDRFGRRRIFLIGASGSRWPPRSAGWRPASRCSIAARALEGIGGALLTPGTLAIIQASFAAVTAPAVGAWSGLGGVASAIGPFVGGWLVQPAGWRWVFLTICRWRCCPCAGALRHVPESRDPRRAAPSTLLGAVLGAVGLGGVTYGLIEAPERPGNAAGPLAAGVLGVAAAVAFIVIERRGAPVIRTASRRCCRSMSSPRGSSPRST